MKIFTDEEIKELAIERYGNDPHSFGQQRDGFEEGFKYHQNLTIKENEWISIYDERYPKLGIAVMVRLKSGYMSVGYRKQEADRVAWQIFGDIIDTPNTDELTHWMPLPQQPK